MTMTLEDLKAELCHDSGGMLVRSFDAAIRERDRLRGDVDGLRDSLERAEAELAALKARIADSPVASVRVDDRLHVSIGARSNAVDFVPLHTKRVRLLLEEPAERAEE